MKGDHWNKAQEIEMLVSSLLLALLLGQVFGLNNWKNGVAQLKNRKALL